MDLDLDESELTSIIIGRQMTGEKLRNDMADLLLPSGTGTAVGLNSTAGINSTVTATVTAPTSDGNQVSRGEVFGLFLTLSFCLLSQPPGSLI
ncbi:uncharacterized protein THITE_152457 [Thermothielavioides terrestris NRRL 8126]|uniref:Uncharacterized protein n=1 Tax=Thermothielavioides terrestris (strain ATCC 38088 / NRRL 8126) TaxID=578455 RepID=G2R4A2_THETT|nr:uncharacterized protein THITE_152457 [Thermothielavioides terrestris NRRL 8126]AEO66049.1 hypothetical protein THITE_152457 [Thermothielavioides terrestris NRRL 8126]